MRMINSVLQLTKEEHETLIECLCPDIQPNQKFETFVYIHVINGVVKNPNIEPPLDEHTESKLYKILRELSAIDKDGDIVKVHIDTTNNTSKSTIFYIHTLPLAVYECKDEPRPIADILRALGLKHSEWLDARRLNDLTSGSNKGYNITPQEHKLLWKWFDTLSTMNNKRVDEVHFFIEEPKPEPEKNYTFKISANFTESNGPTLLVLDNQDNITNTIQGERALKVYGELCTKNAYQDEKTAWKFIMETMINNYTRHRKYNE